MNQTIMDIIYNWPNEVTHERTYEGMLDKRTIDHIIDNIYKNSLDATVLFLQQKFRLNDQLNADFANAIGEAADNDATNTIDYKHDSHRLYLSLENIKKTMESHFEMSDTVAKKLAVKMQKNGKIIIYNKIKVAWERIVGPRPTPADKQLYSIVLWLAQERGKDNLVSTLLQHVNRHFVRSLHRLYSLREQRCLRRCASTDHSNLIFKKQQEIVRIMLTAQNLDVNIADQDSLHPLFLASNNNDDTLVKALLVRGALVNQPTGDGTTPLYVACERGFEKITSILLNAPYINVNQSKSNGSTPLYVACEKGFDNITSILLNAPNIDVNMSVLKDGWTPLTVACEKGKMSIVQSLLARDDILVNKPLKNDDTPLIIAASNYHVVVIDALLKMKDIDINAVSSEDGSTALHILCYRSCLRDQLDFERIYACISHLLEDENIKCDTQDNDGHTPFSFTAFSKWKSEVEVGVRLQKIQLLLLNAGANGEQIFRGEKAEHGIARLQYNEQKLENSKQASLAEKMLKKKPYLIPPRAQDIVRGMIGQYCSVCNRLIHGEWYNIDGETKCIACFSSTSSDVRRTQKSLFRQYEAKKRVF